MTHRTDFDAAFERCPLIAILRGVRPDEVEAIGEALVEAGFAIIEVPLNSPEPLESIRRLAERFAGRAVIGAGTVLKAGEVAAVAEAGGTLIISPNADVRVVAATVEQGLVSLPGIFTPTEAIAALDAGAAALKLFPAEAAGPPVLKAMLAILPPGTRLLPVGGVIPSSLGPWLAKGAAGFGLGSALFTPDMSPADVSVRARDFITAWEAACEQ
ncbi:MAG TPA: 2-dehydro-3-deoxy-6-phosphogalactonate aldolase [Sphingomicrobium sp.]|nr:2-dehydro-3-deoxy-6-phosphogalactonate aldolase [Sphingomicrobium sp.]